MKIVGIFRGFPGLGRVVAGMEILKEFQASRNALVKVFTYLQGFEYARGSAFEISTIESPNDLCQVGIMPVSKSGEGIVAEIEKFEPDFILIDGEPLLVSLIKLRFPHLTVVVLLNPFDVTNKNLPVSTQLFFEDCYAKADICIVHGLWEIDKPLRFNNKFFSVNTFVRKEIRNIRNDPSSDRIVCLLGGGTVRTADAFLQNTFKIADHSILLARDHPNLLFDIFCGCREIYEQVSANIDPLPNIRLHREIMPSLKIFESARMVISRAGRNTISEILTIGIPALLFATNCQIRGHEQQANIVAAQKLSSSIMGMAIESSSKMAGEIFSQLMTSQNNKSPWLSGNNELFKILEEEIQCI